MTTVAEIVSTGDHHGAWRLVPERSTVSFTSRSLWGLMAVKGRFEDVSGSGRVTGGDGPGEVSGRLDVQTASVRTGIGKRDEHLRSPDFFDAERFPTISLVVTSAPTTGSNAVEVQSTLTVKSTARPLHLPASVTLLDDGAIRISARASIDRHDFGVDGNLLGMVTAVTDVSAEAVFVRST